MVFGRRRLSCISFSPKAHGSNEFYYLKDFFYPFFLYNSFPFLWLKFFTISYNFYIVH